MKWLRRPVRALLLPALLLVFSLLLMTAAQRESGFAQWYATQLYPLLVGSIGWFSGLFPLSLAELGLYALLVLLPGRLLFGFVLVLRKKREMLSFTLDYLRLLITLAAVLFTLYVLTCGINYYRTSFSEEAGFTVRERSVSELTQLCEFLVEELNAAGEEIQTDENGQLQLPEKVTELAVAAMEGLGESYPSLSGYYPSPKLLLFSWILSVQQVSGVYSPFTVEANVNADMTAYNIPSTLCHELSHLRGFMREDEANFIAFLACYYSDSAEFRYSGLMLAYIYCMNALYSADYEAWQELSARLAPAIAADSAANTAFWSQYDTVAASVQTSVNDAYLKLNGQESGVQSYGQVVDLLLSWWEEG